MRLEQISSERLAGYFVGMRGSGKTEYLIKKAAELNSSLRTVVFFVRTDHEVSRVNDVLIQRLPERIRGGIWSVTQMIPNLYVLNYNKPMIPILTVDYVLIDEIRFFTAEMYRHIIPQIIEPAGSIYATDTIQYNEK